MNPSNLGNASENSSNFTFPMPPTVPNRSKWRSVKVKKHRGSNSNGDRISSSFSSLGSDVKLENFDMGFVFGASRNDLNLNLNSGSREFSDIEATTPLNFSVMGTSDPSVSDVKIKNCGMGFVFGASRDDLSLNLNSESRGISGIGAKMGSKSVSFNPFRAASGSEGAIGSNSSGTSFSNSTSDDKFEKNGNLGFVFGARSEKLDLKNRNCEIRGTLDKGKVVIENEIDSKSVSDSLDQGFNLLQTVLDDLDRGNDVGSSSSSFSTSTSEIKHETFDHMGFVYGASRIHLETNSVLKSRGFSENGQDLDKDKVVVENEGDSKSVPTTTNPNLNPFPTVLNCSNQPIDGGGCSTSTSTFVFGASWNDSPANMNSGNRVDTMKVGDNGSNSKSNADLEKRESNDINKSGFDDKVFRSTSFNFPELMNKLNIDNAEKFDGNTTADANNIFVFESSKNVSVSSTTSSETRNSSIKVEQQANVSDKRVDDSTAEISNVKQFNFTQNQPNENAKVNGFVFEANFISELSKKIVLKGKSRSIKDRRLKNIKGKMKQTTMAKKQPEVDFFSKGNTSPEKPDTPESYSPMDFSPYRSPVSTDSEDTKCEESTGLASKSSSEKPSSDSKDSKVECLDSKGDMGGINNDASIASAETEGVFASKPDEAEGCFTFVASSSAQGCSLMTKSRYRRKCRKKDVRDSYSFPLCSKVENPSSEYFPLSSSTSVPSSTQKDQETDSSVSSHVNISQPDENRDNLDSVSPSASIEEVCEKWRLRGNQAYQDGDMAKAELMYTRGINCVRRGKKTVCSFEPLVLCYSNRAAARMTLRRLREALSDCTAAIALDPIFIKVQIRAANCHLVLGEVDHALQYFSKCLDSTASVCLDRRLIIEACNGLQKAQKVAQCINRSVELLQQRTSDAAVEALEMIADASSISLYSEKLLQMKAEALCMLRKYDEVIQLCEQTLDFAEKNFATSGISVRLWRCHLKAKSFFHLGNLTKALDLLDKQEKDGSVEYKDGTKTEELSTPLAVTIRELLRLKNAGNEAFKSGKHAEAVEHYTAALSSSVESRPFVAVCSCNRAAAYQAMGQIADAIADCSLAIALDGNYSKAVSRRATLHEMIRDYGQAILDLQRLIYILEKQSDERAPHSGTPGGQDLKKAHQHLSLMEEESKKGNPLDLYLILGIKQSDTAAEIKKAYRKAALRHHPDKAGQFLARSESGDDGCLWREIADEVHKDADRLFKMIGEAYAVLSDVAKRSDYDREEEKRKATKEMKGRGTPRRYSNYEYEGSFNRECWHETWSRRNNPNSHYSRW